MAGGRISWRMLYRLDGAQPSITFDTEDEAHHWCGVLNAVGVETGLRLLAEALAPPSPAVARAPTVRAVVEYHIEHLTGVQDGTRVDYRDDAERDIYPTLGDLPITDFDEEKGRRWVNGLSSETRRVGDKVGPLSGKSIKNRHALLSAACATAVARNELVTNPIHGLKLPEVNTEDNVFLTGDEWWIVHDSLDEYWRPFATFLVGTGLRFGEATALRVCEVNLAARRLRVNRAWKSAGGSKRVIGTPKSFAGKRWVPFDDQVGQVLEPLIEGRPGTELVFVNRQGRRILNNSFHSRAWSPAMRRAAAAGLRQRPRVHDLRHTFASWTLASGEVSLFTLAVIIGHDDLKLLRKRYGHLMPESMNAVARVAGAMLERPTPVPARGTPPQQ